MNGHQGWSRLTSPIRLRRLFPPRCTNASQNENEQMILKVIDANRDLDGNQLFEFKGAGDLSGSAGELVYTFTNDRQTVISGDTNGARVADVQITLDGYIFVGERDFVP